jgi:hypothetical protein
MQLPSVAAAPLAAQATLPSQFPHTSYSEITTSRGYFSGRNGFFDPSVSKLRRTYLGIAVFHYYIVRAKPYHFYFPLLRRSH